MSEWVGEKDKTSSALSWVGISEPHIALVAELAEDNEYWSRVFSFIKSIEHRRLDSLSNKQRQWLDDIAATLTVEVDRRMARKIFDCPIEKGVQYSRVREQ